MFTKNEYESILKTIYQISNINLSQSNEGFKYAVLQLFSQNLHFHHTLFWEVSNEHLHDTPVLYNMDQHTLQNYLSTYQYYDPLHPTNIQKQQSIQLMHENHDCPPKHMEYYKKHFLKANAYDDEMVMYIKKEQESVAAIGLLRKDHEPRFNQKDMLTLLYLKHTIENHYLLHQYTKPRSTIYVTEREEEILEYICRGYKNIDIAKQLFVSENTVKKHLQNLYRKFQVTSRTELAISYLHCKK
ncbi:response regulator transcription factor [Lysinibacillus sp. LZ02]|uniref:response regulator transcription factor n=1 Tax=Lysinibacillus sp. LZ02 TaxID=3420668 RepID=UPI003D3690B0